MPVSDSPSILNALEHVDGRADRLLAITLRLNRMRDPDALLNFIIETAADVLDCEAASILLYDEPTEELHFAAATGSDPESLSDIPVPLDDSIAGTVFTSNEPLIIDDTAHDERHFDDVGDQVGFQTRSLVGVPMRIEAEPVGVLEGLNKSNGTFTDEDVAVLSVLAAQAAVAIRNARQVQALEEANEKLSRLDALKSDFLALASHELRTPIAKVKGFAEILEEEAGDSVGEHVSTILEATAQMEDVVDTMAQMDALRTGGDVLSPVSTSLQSVLRDALEETRGLADEHGHTVTVELPEAPITLRADPERLTLVFSHLLTNAFTFTPEGGRITVEAGKTDGDIRAAVHDTGKGLPEAELDRIFDDFYQVEDSLTRTHGGLGLGLTIARKLVELHGGHIWAESPGPGEGTSLYVRLPAEPSPGTARRHG